MADSYYEAGRSLSKKRRRSVGEDAQTRRNGEMPESISQNELQLAKRLHKVEEAMNFLTKVPSDRAEEIIAFIKAAKDPISALSSLHHGIQRSTALSNYKATRATFPTQVNQIAYQLSLSHPAIYPMLVPINQRLIPVDKHLAFNVSYGTSAFNDDLATATVDTSKRTTQSNNLDPTPSAWQSPGSPRSSSPRSSSLSPPATLVDQRLYSLRINQWTDVPISDELAAKMLSLYLETDHALLGWFDTELFITALCGGIVGSNFCSPFLVSSLYYWISKAYTAIDGQSFWLGRQFLEEAKARWQVVAEEDSILTVAACMILDLGLTTDGEDVTSLLFIQEGIAMGERLRLFNVEKFAEEIAMDEATSANEYRAKAHIAWAAYNWICVHSSFFKEQPLAHPPSFFIPENSLSYMGNTFAILCKLRVLSAEVITVYNAKGSSLFVADSGTLAFAEGKYHQLLEWTDNLETSQAQRGHFEVPHHAMVFHIWVHTVIVDIFRPFVSKDLTLQSFTGTTDNTPDAIYEASLTQLQRLVVEYWQSQPAARYSLLWHVSLLYTGIAILDSPRERRDWRFYLDLYVAAYSHLYICYHSAAGFLQGLLFIALKNDFLSKAEATKIQNRLFLKGQHSPTVTQTSTHLVDYEQALIIQSSVEIDLLAKRVEELAT